MVKGIGYKAFWDLPRKQAKKINNTYYIKSYNSDAKATKLNKVINFYLKLRVSTHRNDAMDRRDCHSWKRVGIDDVEHGMIITGVVEQGGARCLHVQWDTPEQDTTFNKL